jgi:microcystin-dependent protein
MADELEILADQIGPDIAHPPASIDTGSVTEIVDNLHVKIDLGDKLVTATLPGSLAGGAPVGATVKVSTQGNIYIIDSIISGGTLYMVPVGIISPWLTATPPTGWLLCDGSTFDAGTYPALNTYLGGNTLPNLAGKFLLGKDGSHALKGTGGSFSITQTVSQMPSHNHNLVHTHTTGYTIASPGIREGTGSYVQVAVDAAGGTSTGGASTAITSNNGSGTAMDITNPWYGCNWIIRAG